MTTPETTPARSAPFSYGTHGMLIEHRFAAGQAAVAKRIPIVFRYDPAEPFAVTMLLDYALIGPGERSEWIFARRTLAEGRAAVVGTRPGSDVAIAPHACGQFVEFALVDRRANRAYRVSVEMVDVQAALTAFDGIIALAAEPHIAPSLDAIGAELRAMIEQETGRGGDR
ncbi:SsgA family sporulation/cell division regulator [Amycolatopsis eburnea]|uniref:SsgA family sporulation/cell division regulator n=1 Tax=Amycolatopsis eburnea TaxID=2267691 RepID=A0A427TPZ0_9PSEU|nr:SsgA family sporulation/cell division regulator [Amycolatopsis eburnea]RSD26378.1 SsgA family sporulation/cell division regulator [Amycolatopsis eburnea]